MRNSDMKKHTTQTPRKILGFFTIWHPKIEEGTFATDWTPAPEDPGSANEVHNSMVELTAREFSVTFDDKKVMSVMENSIRADVDVLTATGHIDGDVVNTVQFTTININESEIPESKLEGIGKYISGTVYVNLYGYVSKPVKLEGFCGSGKIIVTFKNNSQLRNYLEIVGCTCLVEVTSNNDSYIHIVGSNTAGINIENCQYVRISGVNLDPVTSTEYAINIYNSLVDISACQFNNCKRAIIAEHNSHVLVANCSGGTSSTKRCVRFLSMQTGSIATINGTYSTALTEIDSGGLLLGEPTNAADGAASTILPVMDDLTKAATSMYYCAYQGSTMVDSWTSGNMKTGLMNNKYYRGIGILENANEIAVFLSGTTVSSAVVTVYRDMSDGGTTGSAARAKLYTHNLSAAPSGEVTLTDTGITATQKGKVFIFTLDSTVIAGLKNGTVKGFGFRDWNDNGTVSYFEFKEMYLSVIYS